MKISTIRVFALAFLALLMSQNVVKACNLSDVTPINIRRLGPLPAGPWQIIFRLCVGMGITGSTKCGDQITSSLYFGFYDSQPGFLVTAFTPASLIGPNVGVGRCTMPGTNFGPDPYFGLQGEVIYTDPGYYGDPPCLQHSYGCVTTTPICGTAQAFCRNCSITVNQIPDSMRVFGVEGGGNPVGGCYPNPDMMINFNSFLPVVWGEIEGVRTTAGINIKWSTLEEINTDYFEVQRSVDGVNFDAIGQVPSLEGYSINMARYEFFDGSPNPGNNLYRIVQYDKSGDFNDSETIEVNYFEPEGMSWGSVGPNPASEYLNVSFYSPVAESTTLQLRDAAGKTVISSTVAAINGGNTLGVDLSKINAGNYFLSIQGANGKLVRKIVKL